MAWLRIIKGTDAGKVFEAADEVTAIGRSADNDVVLNDNAASRHHARLLRREGRHYIRDLGSTHGTHVNGVRDNLEMLLGDGDLIRIGTSEMRFGLHAPGGEPEEPAPEAPAAPGAWDLDLLAEDKGTETIAFSLPTDTTPAGSALPGHHLAMLARVAEATQSIFDLEELLGALMDLLFQIFHPDRGVVLLRAKDDTLRPHVKRPQDARMKISRTIIAHAIEKRMALLVSNPAGDERFSASESVFAQSIQSAICSPLVCRDRVLGVLYLDAQHRLMSYQKEELELLNIIAANAAIAIDNALLVQDKLEAERMAAVGLAVAGISHYVKNILTGIRGSANLIDTALARDNMGVIREAWPVMQRATGKLGTLVQDMLTFSRPRQPECRIGSLNELLREIHEHQSARALEIGVGLELDLDPAVGKTEFDPAMLHDAVLNLVGNAVEACEAAPGAVVLLRSRMADAGTVCLSVEDNGPGIAPAIRQKIFDPFFTTKGSRGTGLGLSVTRKCVEEHGGRMLLDSEVGKGTIFKILLPRQRRRAAVPGEGD